jgi:hypothetical protein
MDTQGNQPSASKWGWRILLFVSFLMVLNGVSWFFIGPNMMVSYLDQIAGTPSVDLRGTYPAIAEHVTRNARQVAIWMGALGMLALIVSREGSRNGSRWAWNAMWVFVAAPTAVGLNYLYGELGYDNIGLLSFAGIALVGQLLARRGLAT